MRKQKEVIINDPDIKVFTIRIHKEMWKFLKMYSIEQEVPMNDFIVKALDKHRKSFEKGDKNERRMV
jgi:hypothetical protein